MTIVVNLMNNLKKKFAAESSKIPSETVLFGNKENANCENTINDASEEEYKIEYKWLNIIVFIYLHITSAYTFIDAPKNWATIIVQLVFAGASGFGTTAGSHRLFTHRSYVAKSFMKCGLIIVQTMSGQEPILRWVRDHRVHHKFTDTNADPHNSRRGLFFSHMGWLCCKKHPDVKKYGAKIDMSDLENDKILQFQRTVYTPAAILTGFIIPIALTMYFGEEFWPALYVNIFRYTLLLHIVWSINSFAHYYGYRPYDKTISPTDSRLIAFLALGEGWHNYHHVYPWDYKTAELPGYWFNVTTMFIDIARWLGLASDLKTVPDNIIHQRVSRTGDGTHPFSVEGSRKQDLNNNENDFAKEIDNLETATHFWGYGDKEMSNDDYRNVQILHKHVE